MRKSGLGHWRWLLVLLFMLAERETEHLKCLELPTSQPNSHQEEEYDSHNHANDEVLAFEKFRNAERFGIIVIQLA